MSTSLAHVAHILMLASHYLAIRLPAEIILPHRDYPRPTIFSVAASYRHGEVPFPGSAVPAQVPADSPHPRPLFIDRPLPTLAKEDPATYALFVEGVVLLAYNIAWACCSQGVAFGDRNSYEDVCNMGQNLWRLLIGDQLHRKSVEPAFPTSHGHADGNTKEDAVDDIGRHKPRIGRWSHGATHTFLGSVDGTEFSRGFKLLSPTKLVDRLKKRLASEVPILEWERIEANEVRAMDWEAGGELVKGRQQGNSGQGSFGVESVATTQRGGAGTGALDDGSRASGTSGWTKLKHRQD